MLAPNVWLELGAGEGDVVEVTLRDVELGLEDGARLSTVAWMDDHSTALYLSAVTIAEIEDGIAKARRTGATRKSTELAAWLATLLHLYSDRILVFDVAVARVAGALADRGYQLAHVP